MRVTRKPRLDLQVLVDSVGAATTLSEYQKDQIIFSQGSSANIVFYIRKGGVKLTVLSEHGKEAVIAILAGC